MQARIKHSKFKDSGILFELLIRQVTSDIMYSKESRGVDLLKKYFTNTELSKELSLYSALLKETNLTESKAEALLNIIIDQGKKLNAEKLDKEKYNFIREIKKHYDLDNFFKAKVKDYKVNAAIYTLLEAAKSKTLVSTEQLVKSKNIILERIIKNPITNLDDKSDLSDFLKEEKAVQILSYKFLVEKFNSKYGVLSEEQKEILKEYINNISDTAQLKEFLNEKLVKVKTVLTKLKPKVDNQVTKIKLEEVIKNIEPLSAKQNIKDDHLISLLQYLELAREIKSTN